MEPIDWRRVASVLVGCVALIVATGTIAFSVRKCPPSADASDTTSCPDLEDWLDQDTSTKSILVGSAAGMAFGLIDNTLLWVGMSALDTVFARLPGGTEANVLAGYGNAFSSIVSAFVSTFVGRFIADTANVDVDKAPLWSMALGIFVGCLVGMFVPRKIAELLSG